MSTADPIPPLALLLSEAHADLLTWATRAAVQAEHDRDRWLEMPAFVRRDPTVTAGLVSRAAGLVSEARLIARIGPVVTIELDVWAGDVRLTVGEA